MKKAIKIILPIIIVMIVCITGFILVDSKLPDYVNDNNIPKGYINSGGFEYAGQDLDIQKWYKYEKKPNLNKKFLPIDKSNIDDIRNAILISNETDSVITDISIIDNTDYFYLKAWDDNGNDVAFNYNPQDERAHFQLYLFDSNENTLYKIVISW